MQGNYLCPHRRDNLRQGKAHVKGKGIEELHEEGLKNERALSETKCENEEPSFVPSLSPSYDIY